MHSDLYRLTNTGSQNPLSGVLLMQCPHTTCYIRVSRPKDLLRFEPEGRREGDCFQFLPRKNYGDGRCERARLSPQNEEPRAPLPFRIATSRSIAVYAYLTQLLSSQNQRSSRPSPSSKPAGDRVNLTRQALSPFAQNDSPPMHVLGEEGLQGGQLVVRPAAPSPARGTHLPPAAWCLSFGRGHKYVHDAEPVQTGLRSDGHPPLPPDGPAPPSASANRPLPNSPGPAPAP